VELSDSFYDPFHSAKKNSVDKTQRTREREDLCKGFLDQAIRDADSAGWREQEIAVCLATLMMIISCISPTFRHRPPASTRLSISK
jgi:hypothetical protein